MSDQDPDIEDVRRIAAGDAAAAASLVRRRAPKILALARRMLNDPAEAEDVAQEVFLRVWKHAGSWQPGAAKFETWLHRVATNLCLDRLRRRREVRMGDDFPEIPDDAPSSDETIMASQRLLRVREALDALPERQRMAIELCNFQELSNIEAAAALEVSVDALESLLARGRKSLRQALAGEMNEWLGTVDG
ncbi:MAG: RNA polymerase sigma factor [Caulobacterales bacterium]